MLHNSYIYLKQIYSKAIHNRSGDTNKIYRKMGRKILLIRNFILFPTVDLFVSLNIGRFLSFIENQ